MNVAPKWITIISGLQIFALTIYLIYLEEDKINSLPFIPKFILALISLYGWFVVCLMSYVLLNLKWTIVISGLQIFALAIYLVYLEYSKIDVLPKSILVFISWSVGCLFFFGVILFLFLIYFLLLISYFLFYFFRWWTWTLGSIGTKKLKMKLEDLNSPYEKSRVKTIRNLLFWKIQKLKEVIPPPFSTVLSTTSL